MTKFNRFGNMSATPEMKKRSYVMAEKPFKIAGNLYFVGNTHACSHLIDTGEGLILLDTPSFPEFAYLIDSIWQLGFDPRKIKYLIVSHAHGDHYGCAHAMRYLYGCKILMGEVDVEDMRVNRAQFEAKDKERGTYNPLFEADVALKDGDIVELGNTKIRCIWTPGHTVGCMSHFWDLIDDDGKVYKVGIYGGAGFVTMSTEALKKARLPLSMQKTFVDSIDKVWDEPVDIMLGNHPFHNDTYDKQERRVEGGPNPFIDPTEWHRYLQELKYAYSEFLKLTPEQVEEMYRGNGFPAYRPAAFERLKKYTE